MVTQLVVGQVLTITSDRDVIIQRKLVSVDNGVFYVCKQDEFDAAIRENREPCCIGFRPEYIMELRGDSLGS